MGNIMTSKELDEIDWTRTESDFEVVLGRFILRKSFEFIRGPRVLDVGCGDGFLTKEVAKRYDKVVGVDGSKDKIELAMKNVPGVEFHVSLFEDFEYDEKFDSIVMINILEHVDDPVQCLKKARELLAPHGEVVIFVPNALALNRRIGKAMGIIKHNYELSRNDLFVGHKRFYDKWRLISDITNSALRVGEIGGIFLKPLSNSQMEEWDPDIFEALYEVGMELPDYCGLIYARVVI